MSRTENQNVLEAGTVLHQRFFVKKVIGVCGFGITYLGEDTLLQSQVAIKEYMPQGYLRGMTGALETSGDEAFLKGMEDFLHEARLLSLCQELDGVVSVRDFFRENGTAYLVMDYISGTSVKERVWEQGAQAPGEALFLMKPVIYSLAKLHKVGYIHRDISSDNLLYTSQNRLKLIDFGAARKMNPEGGTTRTVMFKRGYAAEEQYRTRGKQGAWTDVYGICAVLYFMLTGVVPAEAVERVIKDQVTPLAEMEQLSLDLDKKQAIDKGMAVFAKDRFQTVDELYEALYTEKIDQAPLENNLAAPAAQGEEVRQKEARQKRIRQSNFMATRTEFLEQRQAYYEESRRNTRRRRRRKVAVAAGCFLAGALCLAGIVFSHHFNGKNPAGEERQISASLPPQGVENGLKASAPEKVREAESTLSPAGTPPADNVRVPRVEKLSKEKAVKKLKARSLSWKIVRRYSDSVSRGRVISQSIQAGKRVKKGKSITLVLSLGKKERPAPSLGPTAKPEKPKSPVAGDITDIFGSE